MATASNQPSRHCPIIVSSSAWPSTSVVHSHCLRGCGRCFIEDVQIGFVFARTTFIGGLEVARVVLWRARRLGEVFSLYPSQVILPRNDSIIDRIIFWWSIPFGPTDK